MNSANQNPPNPVEQWSYQDFCSFHQLIHNSTRLRPSQVREISSTVEALANANMGQFFPPVQQFGVGGQMPQLPVRYQPFNVPQNNGLVPASAFTPNFGVQPLMNPFGAAFQQNKPPAADPLDPLISLLFPQFANLLGNIGNGQQQNDTNNNMNNLFPGADINLQVPNIANIVPNNPDNGNNQAATPGREKRVHFTVDELVQNPQNGSAPANRGGNLNINTVAGGNTEGQVELAIDENVIAEQINNVRMRRFNNFEAPRKRIQESAKRELAIRRAEERKKRREQEIKKAQKNGSVQFTRTGRQVRPPTKYGADLHVKQTRTRPMTQ